MPDEEETKVEIKEIPDNQIDVAINSPSHHIEEIKKEILAIEESISPLKPALAENEDFWEEK